jgi:hypothetical protein
MLVFFTIPANTQTVNEFPEITTEITEELAMHMEDSETTTLMLEWLQELIDDPVMINSGDEEELNRLFFLTDYQIKSLINYTNNTGKIISHYEIATIPGFDRATAEMMVPCVILETYIDNEKRKRWRTEIITNIAFKPGETDSSLLGSNIKELTKIKVVANKIETGTTIEKDAGESFAPEGKFQPDFFSAYISYTGTGTVKRVIIGDYSAKFGQGCNINTNFSTSLSTSSSNLISGKNEIKPYRSTDENNFFRGMATEISTHNISATLLFSRNNVDATVATDEETGEQYVIGLYTAGVHDSWTSLYKKDVLVKTVIGANLEFNINSFKIGATWSGTDFSIPLADHSGDPTEIFDFSGERLFVYSIHYKTTIDRIMAFGEISSNDFNNFALAQGATIRAADRLSINILYRKYEPTYTTFNGRAPGSTSESSNEEGIFGNLFLELHKNLFLTAGADIYRTEWISYRSSFPKKSLKEEIRLKYQPSGSSSLEVSFSNRISEVNGEDLLGVPSKKVESTRSIRFNGTYAASNGITLKTRIEYKRALPSGSTGILLLQDINYSLSSIPISLWFRYSVFNTDSWDTRLYCYENDLLYSFSIPALSGIGSRSYLMVKIDVGRYIDFRVKYAVTSLMGTDNIANENDQLKFQIKVSW